ncbi:HTH-type transcriptional regulator CynR domain protein [Klebsiella pneumoniae JHCK1]|nr:HTH-type transcriptional regulator CynR domain protein [Klebsiella pneumoniae JHCK1]
MGRCFCANFPTLSLWLNIVAFPTPPRRCMSPSLRCHSRYASWKRCWRFSFSTALADVFA